MSQHNSDPLELTQHSELDEQGEAQLSRIHFEQESINRELGNLEAQVPREWEEGRVVDLTGTPDDEGRWAAIERLIKLAGAENDILAGKSTPQGRLLD